MGMGEEIDSDKASRRMGELTRPFFGFPITISVYRHINIAFKRVFCKDEIDGEMDQETMDKIYAYQADHSVSTENRIYGLSSDVISASSGHMIMIYIGISYKWQKVLGVPPGGLGLNYKSARLCEFANLVNDGRIKLTAKAFDDPCTAIADMAARFEEEREFNRNVFSELLDGMKMLRDEVKKLKHGQGTVNIILIGMISTHWRISKVPQKTRCRKTTMEECHAHWNTRMV